MIRETSPVDGQAQVFVSYAKLDAEQVIAIVPPAGKGRDHGLA